MDQHGQEAYLLPSTSLVETQDGLINLVSEGQMVQHIQPSIVSRNVQGMQPIYAGSTMKGVPIFVKFEDSSSQNLMLPGQMVSNSSDIAAQPAAHLPTSTHYILRQTNSPRTMVQSSPTMVAVESYGHSHSQHDLASMVGAKTYIIQSSDTISEGSTIIPVSDALNLGTGGLGLSSISLAGLSTSDVSEDMIITTSPSTCTSMLPDADTATADSPMTLGQENMMLNQHGYVVSQVSGISSTDEECAMEYVVDLKTFLNTDPDEKITDPKAFLNTTEKAAELKSLMEKSAADASTDCKDEEKEDDKESSDEMAGEVNDETKAPPPKVFSSVTATLSESLLKAIPGSKDKFLKQVSKEHKVSLRHDITTDTFIISGETVKILDLEVSLNEMIDVESPEPPRPYRGILNEKNGNIQHIKDPSPEKVDKGVICHLLKPQYSRSGREVKWKTMEDLKSDEEDEIGLDTSDVENSDKKNPSKIVRTPKKTVKNKRKQQKPRKLGAKKAKNGKSAEGIPASLKIPQEEPTYTTILPDDGKEVIGNGSTVEGDEKEDTFSEVTLPIPKPRQLVMPKKCSEKTDSDSSSKDNEKENQYRMGVMTDLESSSKKVKPKKDYEALAPFKFFCNLCSFKTKRESHMKKHRDIHKKGLPLLKCTQCDYTTLRTTHLRRHEMEHSTEFYNCPICKYKSDSKKLLGRHYRVKHTGSQSGPPIAGHAVYTCECCDYKTTRRAQFERHAKCHADVKSKSDQLVKSYMCTLCTYKTTKKEHFLRHNSNVHSERRPYLCDLCGKAFKRRDALKQHWLIHKDKSTRPYPFTCNTCHKGFRCQAHLNEHQTIHSNIRAYLCEICGASFKTRTVQRKHVQSIHKNPRSFACSDCSKRFNTRYGLRRHVKTHDGNENTTENILLQQDVPTSNDEESVALNQQQHIQIQIGDTNIIAELQPIESMEMGEDEGEKGDGHSIQTALIEEALEEGEIHIPVRTYVQQEGGTSEATTALLYLTNFAGIGN